MIWLAVALYAVIGIVVASAVFAMSDGMKWNVAKVVGVFVLCLLAWPWFAGILIARCIE